MENSKGRNLFKFGVVCTLLLTLLASNPTYSEVQNSTSKSISDSIVADWKFSRKYIKSGSIAKGNMVMEDASGNENHLELKTIGQPSPKETNRLIQWSEEDYYGLENVQSMIFHNSKQLSVGRYFETAKNAPINDDTFTEGYTIEAVMKLPKNFSPDKHNGMGLLTRQGQTAGNKNKKETLATLSVSKLPDIQWSSLPTNTNRNETNRSFSLNSENDWYHIAVVNDGQNTELYINGEQDFRNTTAEIVGINAQKGKGWNVASESVNEIDKLFAGNIQEIRIANKPLTEDEWLFTHNRNDHINKGTNKNIRLLSDRDHYNFLFVPDPQKTVRYMPKIFEEQMKWISKKENRYNIEMTAFLGDMVDQSDSKQQWEDSFNSVLLLDKTDTPYITIAGNHDYGKGDPYLKYYGPDHYANKKYYKGASPTGYSSYSIVKAGSYHYLFLAVDMKHIKKDIIWATNILKKHPNVPTILLSHQIINVSGDGKSAINTGKGSLLWDKLVNNYNQIFMTVSGHHLGSTHRIKKNAKGNDVIQMLVDYQKDYHGGNGWMRFAEFDEEHNKISFKTYSPWVDQLPKSKQTYFDVKFLTGKYDQFEIPFSFEDRFDFVE
ncbi:hypothetical protein JOC86_000173 [Bacillus pakistanensis]|uniref:Calcineurin-like phosphoesterase domain-containing protein n=1 Tax=Rossellomorea pakistanensis TaxID=992288 RepID=A0ABS2N705_9BACI|nr:LamG-like jellyroll fold domain-containing protein [Bacillus pakistanensis]MBM7583636.1 hypothetical protein [Bacillus pakistanensis]